MTTLHDTPIAREVDRVQAWLTEQGDDSALYIYGFSEDGRYACIVYGNTVRVASKHTCNGLGRWECSKEHFLAHPDIYSQRFPIR